MLKLLMLLGTQGIAALTTKARFKRKLAGLIAMIAALLAVLLFVAIGFGFAVAALFLWLDRHLDSELAALTTAGTMFLVAGTVVLALQWRRSRTRQRPDPGRSDVASAISSDLKDTVARQPKTALILAMATGLGLGLWLR